MNTEIGYGKRLRNAREAAGLSPDSVAEKLRLKSDVVLSLEEEDQQSLAPAFVRGYIRAYCQLVAEDPDQLVALYNRHAGAEPELARLENIRALQQGSSPVLRWGVILLSLALLAAGAFWLQDYLKAHPGLFGSDIETDVSSQPVPAEVPAGEQDDTAERSIELTLDELAEQNEQQAIDHSELEEVVGIVSQQSGDESDTATAKTGPVAGSDLASAIEAAPSADELKNLDHNEVTPLAPEGTDRLELTFTGPSWIEAVDANDYRLVYGLFDKTDHRLLVRGRAPFKIIVGDTHNVSIRVNDKAYELGAYTRANNTARVRFGENRQATD